MPSTPASERAQEIPLAGGDVTDGVVRVGDTVRRPVGEHTPTVHRVLRHLESVGFEGAPRVLGIDDAGREILTFISGEVAGRPWPGWVADPERGRSVARLLRRLDDAMIPFGLPDGTGAGRRPEGSPEPVGPAPRFMGHRDVTPENTVFREGEAIALIDFDLTRPSSRVDEVVNLLLWWSGWQAPEDRDPAFEGVDVAVHARELVDAYGLPDEERAWLVPASISVAERSWFSMRDRADRLGGGWRRMWEAGVGDTIRRRELWLRESAAVLENRL